VYVTSSDYKRAENDVLVEHVSLSDGTPIGEACRFDLRPVRIQETLEIRITEMVRAEVKQAYTKLRVPCVVEHAGLIFDEYRGLGEDREYPGGLTKPMWDALGDRFLPELSASSRRAVARAVVAYCDGQSVRTFVGETEGHLAPEPRGAREFYWDTVFVPDDVDGNPGTMTYAEIVDDASLGLRHKVEHLSQSTKAMRSFLDWLQSADPPALWPAGV
jgi:XTP/dITP diphosphohydrolase